MHKPIGQSDFYVNYGASQGKSCNFKNQLVCDHMLSYHNFKETIINEVKDFFNGYPCENFDEVLKESCTMIRPLYSMGGEPPTYGLKGIYVVITNFLGSLQWGMGK